MTIGRAKVATALLIALPLLACAAPRAAGDRAAFCSAFLELRSSGERAAGKSLPHVLDSPARARAVVARLPRLAPEAIEADVAVVVQVLGPVLEAAAADGARGLEQALARIPASDRERFAKSQRRMAEYAQEHCSQTK